MYKCDLEYNNTKASDYRILVKKRPNMPCPKMNYSETEIPGRNGTLIEMDGTYGDIVIPVELNYKADKWHSIFRKAKQWLFSKGNGRLIFMDDAAFYYKVKRVEIEENERISLRIGNFTVSFICEPFQYALDGDKEYPLEKVLYNPYFTACPTYIIKGEGDCELQVNGNMMQINVGQEIVIDTERMLVYREETLLNTSVSGNYEDLYLLSGENTITVTEGFEVTVIPHWRCL